MSKPVKWTMVLRGVERRALIEILSAVRWKADEITVDGHSQFSARACRAAINAGALREHLLATQSQEIAGLERKR